MNERVHHPKHYTSHPSGVEAIEITEHYNFCIGNAIKYLWRQGLKDEASLAPIQKQIEDCEKAVWYINREIRNLKEGVYNGKNKQKQNQNVAANGSSGKCSSRSQAPREENSQPFSIRNAESSTSAGYGIITERPFHPYNDGKETSSTGSGSSRGTSSSGISTITITNNGTSFGFTDNTMNTQTSQVKVDKDNSPYYYTLHGGTVGFGASSMWDVVMKEHINGTK